MRRATTCAVSLAVAVVCLVVVRMQAQALLSQGGLTSEGFRPQGVGGQEVNMPRWVQFSGVLKDAMGQPLSGVQGITFALYKEQSGGAALWLETQNVTLDEQGRYSVLLGSTQSEGLPLELFSSGEARWLGVQAIQSRDSNGAVLPELPRVLLVSVPYALKAADSETLGGLPASAFVLSSAAKAAVASTSLVADKAGLPSGASAQEGLPVAAFSTGIPTAAAPSGSGTTNNIVKWLDGSGTLGDAMNVVEVGGNVGIGTTSPSKTLDVAGTVRIATPGTDILQFINTGTGKQWTHYLAGNDMRYYEYGPNLDRLTLQADTGNIGIGTTTPSERLEVAGNLKVSGNIINGSGTISLPNTVNASTGVITLGGNPFLHNFGSGNTFLGENAGNFTMTGYQNSASGDSALYSNTTGFGNTASGAYALNANTTGFENTANGFSALNANNIGVQNTASGALALQFNTTGSYNTASGVATLYKNTSGLDNTASGTAALYNNTTGSFNTASGRDALFYNTTGYGNAANGHYALRTNTTGYSNTASGSSALYYNTTGFNNTAIGYAAGAPYSSSANGNTTGSYNTFIGSNSGPGVNGTTTPLTNATAIGANAVVSASNALVLGSISGVNGATSDVNVGIGTATPGAKLDVVGAIRATVPGTDALEFVNTGAGNKMWTLYPTGADLRYFESGPNQDRLTLQGNTGNIGIGATNPATKLDVAGTIRIATPGTDILRFVNLITGKQWTHYLAGDDMRYYEYGPNVDRLTIQGNTGNVGIGTTNPAAALDVVGNVKVSGGLAVGGGASITNSNNVVQSVAGALTVILTTADVVPSGGCITHVASAPGATTSMVAVISPAGNPIANGLSDVLWSAYVDANDHVTAQFCKFARNNASPLVNQTFNIRIIK